ncbi:MAG: aconitase family protein, partial [Candidatus Hodarchaeales archaeon]
MSMIEKIIQNHSSDEVKPGKIVWMDLDVRSARDFAGANVVQNLERNYPAGRKIADLDKTVFTFDCVVPANNVGYAQNQQIIRMFAREEKIKVFDVDSGIGSHVLIEKGLALPGGTVIGTDSHLNIMGAIGCFGQGMGDQDIAFGFKSGKTWFEVPKSVKINVKGEMSNKASPKDLTLALVKYFTSSGLLGVSGEFYGKPVDKLDLSGRITLSSMVTEMG